MLFVCVGPFSRLPNIVQRSVNQNWGCIKSNVFNMILIHIIIINFHSLKKKEKYDALLTQAVSQTSILSILPKTVDPVMLWQAWVVATWVAHWSSNRATHLLHTSRLWPIQSGRLDSPVRGYGATEEGSAVATTSVGRAELLLLLLTLLGHPWVLRLVDPVRKPGDWILWGEGSSTGRMWRKSRVGWCQVVVEGSLGSWGIFSMEQCIRKSNKPIWLRV